MRRRTSGTDDPRSGLGQHLARVAHDGVEFCAREAARKGRHRIAALGDQTTLLRRIWVLLDDLAVSQLRASTAATSAARMSVYIRQLAAPPVLMAKAVC